MSALHIASTLREELKTNSLNLTVCQIDWIDQFLYKSVDFIPKLRDLVANISGNFQLVNIPPFVLDLVGVVKSSSVVNGKGNSDMYLILIKFIMVALIDSGIIFIPETELDRYENILKVSIYLLASDVIFVEAEVETVWSRFKNLFCSAV